MTNDEKQVLRTVGALVAFKAVLYASLIYAAKVVRDANLKYDREGLSRGVTIFEETGVIGGHVESVKNPSE